MTVHFAPSTACNLACNYCYQTPDRAIREGSDRVRHHYDLDKVLAQLEDFKERYPHEMPGFHGGEPLLMPVEDMEVVMKWIYEHYGKGMHLQTNGTLIRDEHVALFKKYGVSVGVSVDGPPELNGQRMTANQEPRTTAKMTVRTLRNIVKLRANNVPVGVIVVLSTENAGDDEKLEKLLSFVGNLNHMGVTGHWNPAIPYEDIQTDVSLSGERLAEVYVRTWECLMDPDHLLETWNPMRQAQDNILGLSLGNCVQNRCDVYNAGAAKIVLGDGATTGCGKTWDTVGDGVPFLQGPANGSEYDDGDERYESLMQSPGKYTPGWDGPDLGGCEGCKFWTICQGGCPSAGIDGDFRNRTVFCDAVYALYERIEQDFRAIFPMIRLTTDLPWNADTSELARCANLPLRPFANASVEAKRPSVYRWSEHPHGEPRDAIPESAIPPMTFSERVRMREEQYGKEHVTADPDTGMIHADQETSTEGWEVVEDEEEADE